MTSADQYRVRAAEFAAMAKSEANPALQLEYATIAASYLRLAEQADRNAMNDVAYETPPDQKPAAP
ncbi:MAG TPA: hypothetical protein VFK79_13795 [Xanthobacteraceae bacterium]|nr:hypothetical protein [Xanthobacteraceae bacterium]